MEEEGGLSGEKKSQVWDESSCSEGGVAIPSGQLSAEAGEDEKLSGSWPQRDRRDAALTESTRAQGEESSSFLLQPPTAAPNIHLLLSIGASMSVRRRAAKTRTNQLLRLLDESVLLLLGQF